jgi:hypothetical protein
VHRNKKPNEGEIEMADSSKSTYTVNHGFAHDGVYYARDNEADVANLPANVLADLTERGIVTEHKPVAQSATEA